MEEAVISMCQKSGKKMSRKPHKVEEPWEQCDGYFEAWADVGYLGGVVKEHERLMTLLSALMMESKPSLESIW